MKNNLNIKQNHDEAINAEMSLGDFLSAKHSASSERSRPCFAMNNALRTGLLCSVFFFTLMKTFPFLKIV